MAGQAFRSGVQLIDLPHDVLLTKHLTGREKNLLLTLCLSWLTGNYNHHGLTGQLESISPSFLFLICDGARGNVVL